VVNCSEVLQYSDGLSNKVSNIIRIHRQYDVAAYIFFRFYFYQCVYIISHHISYQISYRIISYHIISYISYHISYHISCRIIYHIFNILSQCATSLSCSNQGSKILDLIT